MGRKTDGTRRDGACGSIGGHASSAPARHATTPPIDAPHGPSHGFAVRRARCETWRGRVFVGVLMGSTALTAVPFADTAHAQTQPPVCTVPTGSPNKVDPRAPRSETNTPATAISVDNSGAQGCRGDNARPANVRANGGSGQPGGDVTQTTMPASGGARVRNGPLSIISDGGEGGVGSSESHSGPFKNAYAARGGVGGDAGKVDQTFVGDIALSSGKTGIAISATGGNGGENGKAEAGLGSARSEPSGRAGDGGDASLAVIGSIKVNNPADVVAIQVDANGGDGGSSNTTNGSGNATAGNGGTGGNAGETFVELRGSRDGSTQGVITGEVRAQSSGGDGGSGGRASSGIAKATSGTGGAGGSGASAGIQTDPDTLITVSSSKDEGSVGLLVESNGGRGGAGGDSVGYTPGSAGSGGRGGDGGAAHLDYAGDVRTQATGKGSHVHGALVQSVGGSGEDGGKASAAFFSKGGAGQNGGDGGEVLVFAQPSSNIRTDGPSSMGIIAQSVGGGGGSGGDAIGISIVGGALAIGGNAGAGGVGGAVTVTLGADNPAPDAVSTITSASLVAGGGVLAQSIGGAGGNGGSAFAGGGGNVNVALGGDGQAGAAAGTATITNKSTIVTTRGDHATGLEAQSIGGGGGKGGGGFSLGVGEVLDVSVSIGGDGGSGGPGAAASITNNGQVITYGSDAPGVKAQSVGGGGGHGGAASATAFAISQIPEVPSVSVALAIGGKGGSGNVGGSATVNNTGFVATGGHGAPAVFAQSIGGGGGYGGDSSASAFAGGGADAEISASVSLGGKGGSGASGGETQVTNEGILATFGSDAPAIVAQSIGGGGGYGGAGDVSATTDESEKLSFSASVTVGGSGGSGGQGQAVYVTNNGGIGTRGDASDGILAQSVGGGGGVGGGGVGKANADSLALTVDVGGNGGTGNNAAYVQVVNTNTIVTSGVASMGMVAQSIGGGGGRGGKGGAKSGGAEDAPSTGLAKALDNGLNNDEDTKEIEPGVIKIGPVSFESDDIDPNKIAKFVESRQADAETSDGKSLSLSVAVGVGGSAGAGGEGNTVLLRNSGQIVTTGALAYGIAAQSVGGGGGIGGASTASTTNDNKLGFSLGVGGASGSGGNAGPVTVDLNRGSRITTSGAGAYGVFAQSVGGGGGVGSVSGAANEAGLVGGRSIGLAIGRNGGSSGDGAKVTVNHLGLRIFTVGKNATGIFAQSIGGGGGTATAMTVDQFSPKSLNDIEDKFNVSLAFGGNGVNSGSGGEVDINVGGPFPNSGNTAVGTDGRNSHGILAQSIGASGGAAVGGKTSGINFFSSGHAGSSGDGGIVNVTTNRDVFTNGLGAYALIAQSIGGGGGIGGDFGGASQLVEMARQTSGSGNGAAVNVNVKDGQIATFGGASTAVFVQSLGGGGGHFSSDGKLHSGSGGAQGKGGPISVTIGPRSNGAITNGVFARGLFSDGISAQSDGGDGGSKITISNDGTIAGGPRGAAIRLRGGDANTPNTITNRTGTILSGGGSGGGAIWVDSATQLLNGGTLSGSLYGPVTGGALMVENLAAGVMATGPEMLLGDGGVIENEGLISVGGAGDVVQTRLLGDLVHKEGGRLVFDVDAENDVVDFLDIEGAAALDGTITVNPISLQKSKKTILSATSGVTGAPGFSTKTPHLFSYEMAVEGRDLTLTTDADFRGATGAQGDSREGLARHLQAIWDSGQPGFGTGFGALASVQESQEYTRTLDHLSGRAVSAVAAARYDASMRLVNSAFSCPTFAASSVLLIEESCTWARTDVADFNRDASGSSIDYSGRSTILTFGGQRELEPGWFLGGVFGYETSKISSTMGATDVDGQAGLGVLALKRVIGPWVIGGAVDLGYGSYDSRRNIAFGSSALQARGSSNAFNAGLHFNASYQKSYGTWYAEPQINLDMTYLRLSGYRETGAGPFNLDVSKSDNVIFSATPAVKLGRRIDLEGGTILNAFATAGVSFLSGNDWESDARFVNAAPSSGSFGTTLNTPDTLGRFSAGVEVYNEGGVNFRVQYSADVASNYLSQRAELRLSLNF